MQRNLYFLSDSQKELANRIENEYFAPFVAILEKSNIVDKSALIQDTLSLFLELENGEEYNFNKIGDLYNDFANAKIPSDLKEKLISHPNLKEEFLRLLTIYINKNIQSAVFFNFNSLAICTMIREMFYDYLNPLSCLDVKKENFISNEFKRDKNSLLFQINPNIQSIIYSFLDYKSIKSLRKTCKSAYFFNEIANPSISNIFYLIAGNVQISFGLNSALINLRKNIPDEEIIASIGDVDSNKMKMFYSQYQALEYANSLRYEDPGNDNNYIPSVWTIQYIGDAKHLKFKTELIEGRRGYGGTRFHTECFHTTVPKNAIIPLVGTVIIPKRKFAEYHQFQTVDLMKQLKKLGKSKCNLM